MKIKNIDFGFVETVEKGDVKELVCMYDGTCTVHFYNRPPLKLNVGCSPFNSQYGIPVSEDGERLFVGSWETGLYAYSILTGKVLWRFRPGKIRNIIVYSKFLIVLRAYTAIVKIDIETGKALAEIKSGTLRHIYDLACPFIYAETISGKHCIVNVETMSVTKKYNAKVINPLDCLSFMLSDVILENNEITIIGREQYPQRRFDPEIAPVGECFSRTIDQKFR